MKFLKDFEKFKKKEWARGYVDYEALNKKIHKIEKAEKDNKDTTKLAEEYKEDLLANAKRADKFYRRRLAVFLKHFPLAIKFNTKEVIVSKKIDGGSKIPYRLKAYEVELKQYFNWAREIVWFCELNLTAIRKSVKKLKSKTSVKGSTEVLEKINKMPFTKHVKVKKSLKKVVILHSNVFTDLNVVKSKKILDDHWKKTASERYNLEDMTKIPIKESAIDIWKEMSNFLDPTVD